MFISLFPLNNPEIFCSRLRLSHLLKTEGKFEYNCFYLACAEFLLVSGLCGFYYCPSLCSQIWFCGPGALCFHGTVLQHARSCQMKSGFVCVCESLIATFSNLTESLRGRNPEMSVKKDCSVRDTSHFTISIRPGCWLLVLCSLYPGLGCPLFLVTPSKYLIFTWCIHVLYPVGLGEKFGVLAAEPRPLIQKRVQNPCSQRRFCVGGPLRV